MIDGPVHNDHVYTREFFQSRQDATARSAGRVVRWVMANLSVSSVVDVGCGNGVWLREFADAGVTDTLGIDGPWVDQRDLQIDPRQFVAADLSGSIPDLGRRFDLAISVEVAEHLPADRARPFVAELTTLADQILFSAAVVGQGGTGHINEQWQSYWAALFLHHGYAAYDAVRPAVWTDQAVNMVHAQNLILYMNTVGRDRCAPLGIAHPVPPSDYVYLDRVHPRLYSRRLNRPPSPSVWSRFRARFRRVWSGP